MTDFPVVARQAYGTNIHIFEFFNLAAITTATCCEWIVPKDMRIVDVIIDSTTAGSGGTSDIADININGTTIYTTQANRPTLVQADTGMWTEAGEPEVTVLRVNDILTLDIDQVSTTGSAKVKVAIVCVVR